MAEYSADWLAEWMVVYSAEMMDRTKVDEMEV